MILLRVLLISLFINSAVLAEETIYVPLVDEVKSVNLDVVKSLKKKSKFISPIAEDTRGIGAEIYKNISPTTVLVQTDHGFGSGFLVDNLGHIITNYHVVQKDFNQPDLFNTSVNLLFCPTPGDDINEQYVYEADVVKVDPSKDLALIKLRTLSPLTGKVIPKIIDNSQNITIGTRVHAIGHPEGLFCTYTEGVVSQIRNKYEWEYDDLNRYKANVVQTNTAINPGNSGGPLVDDQGNVVGINSFTFSNGLNFAVASDEISNFLNTSTNESSWITKKKKEPEECLWDTSIEERDFDENGIKDLFYYDTDCNDVVDTYGYDENEDGEIDLYLIDTNESGTPDVSLEFVTESNGDKYARYYYDPDEDGEYDEVCFDTDLDNEIDECRELS